MAVLNTHKGLYHYNRLAFGIAPAPAPSQRGIKSLLYGLARVNVYLDNIIAAKRKLSVHRHTSRRFSGYNTMASSYIHQAKYRFREKQVSFSEHKIDVMSLHPQRDNLKLVTAAPRPTSVSHPKSFLGLSRITPSSYPAWKRLWLRYTGC